MTSSKDMGPLTDPFFPTIFRHNQFKAKAPPVPSSINLKDQVAVVTGANVGLGLECCRQLLDLKLGHLILAVRSIEKGETAANELRKKYTKSPIEVWKLDLESYDSVQTFARRADKELTRLDIAILNAGLMTFKLWLVKSTGHEHMLQVNYLSTALLSLLLLPALRKGAKEGRPAFRLESNHESPLGDAEHPSRGQDPNVPPKIGTDLSFIDFADTVELSLIGDILKFTKISKQTFFPLEPCIAFDKKLKFQQSFVPLTFDALYLNAMVFSTQSWYCATTSRAIDKRISYHLVRSIGWLRDRLTDAAGEGGKERISDLTINAIVMLAGQALLMGEERTARKHVVGMKRLVEMRGGLSTLEKTTKLLLEVLRIDISLALYTDSPPIFRAACSKERWFRLPQTASTCEAERNTPHLVSDELIQLWLTIHHFATLINNATSAGHKLPEELMLETMAAVMYRLLDMTFEDSSMEQAIRLGLLAFCSQAFLPWMSVKLPFDVFPQAYVRCMEAVTTSGSVTPGLAVWLLTIGSVALFPPGCACDSMRSSLQRIVSDSGVKCWEDMRDILKEYLWLDLIFDDAAAALLEGMVEAPEQDDDTSAGST